MGVGKQTKVLDSVTTTNAGVTSTIVSGLLSYEEAILLIEEEGTNDIEYQVEVTPAFYPDYPVGSDDTSIKWHTLLAWTDLASGAEIALAIGDAWDAVRIKAKSDVTNTHGVVSAWVNRK